MLHVRLLLLAAGACLMTTLSFAADDQEDATQALLKTFIDELVEITPGEGKFPKSFEMGSPDGAKTERPVHEVTIKRPFAIAKYEVPQNLYQAVMGKNPSRWKGKRNSVETMTFREAVKFCDKLTGLLHESQLIADDEAIRLPTEAEWEYCCRAGTKTAYSFGDEARKEGDQNKIASILNEYGWHTGNAAGNDPEVGKLKPNPWGLYDMHGYLWEFTADAWSFSYDGAPTDGSARPVDKSAERKQFVLRGGSWKSPYTELRSAARIAIDPDQSDDAIGIRCVKAKLEKPQTK